MNQHTLHLKLNPKPETLERILRVVRHRGFFIQKMHMQPQTPCQYSLELNVKSDRQIDLLCTQLQKLVDVIHCHTTLAPFGQLSSMAPSRKALPSEELKEVL